MCFFLIVKGCYIQVVSENPFAFELWGIYVALSVKSALKVVKVHSSFFYLLWAPSSSPFLEATMKLGSSKAGLLGGVRGRVCICVHFLLSPITFWSQRELISGIIMEQSPMILYSNTKITELSGTSLYINSSLFSLCLQIRNSRVQRLCFASLYLERMTRLFSLPLAGCVGSDNCSESLGHSSRVLESKFFSFFSPYLISWPANCHVM